MFKYALKLGLCVRMCADVWPAAINNLSCFFVFFKMSHGRKSAT